MALAPGGLHSLKAHVASLWSRAPAAAAAALSVRELLHGGSVSSIPGSTAMVSFHGRLRTLTFCGRVPCGDSGTAAVPSPSPRPRGGAAAAAAEAPRCCPGLQPQDEGEALHRGLPHSRQGEALNTFCRSSFSQHLRSFTFCGLLENNYNSISILSIDSQQTPPPSSPPPSSPPHCLPGGPVHQPVIGAGAPSRSGGGRLGSGVRRSPAASRGRRPGSTQRPSAAPASTPGAPGSLSAPTAAARKDRAREQLLSLSRCRAVETREQQRWGLRLRVQLSLRECPR